MRTLAESLASIGESIELIFGIKANIKTAIEAKGVTVPDGVLFSSYPELIAEIEGGGLAGLNLPNRFLIAGDKRKLTVKAGTVLPLMVGEAVKFFIAAEDTELDLETILDTGSLVLRPKQI